MPACRSRASGRRHGSWRRALIVGKPAGIVLTTVLAERAGLTRPAGLSYRDVLVIGMTAGIGFTVALFFATAAFPPGAALDAAKMGALLSFLAAPAAIVLARLAAPPVQPGAQPDHDRGLDDQVHFVGQRVRAGRRHERQRQRDGRGGEAERGQRSRRIGQQPHLRREQVQVRNEVDQDREVDQDVVGLLDRRRAAGHAEEDARRGRSPTPRSTARSARRSGVR